MPELITMPKLGFDMAEGTLVRWVKKEGESIAKGDVLAEIETDKATVEVEAAAGGVIAAQFVGEGSVVPIGKLIAAIAAPGEAVDVNALRAQTGSSAPPSTSVATPAKKEIPPALVAPAPMTAPAPAAVSVPTDGKGREVFASPIARKMAGDAGVDIRLVSGTGPGGRIVKRDVEAYLKSGGARAAAPALPVAVSREDIEVPLTRLRQIIGRRMSESQLAAPHFYVTVEVDMAPAMALRGQLNALLPEDEKISVNDFIVKAAALALRQFPNLNASVAGDKLIRRGRINVGLAVAVEGGLITPVVQDADLKSLAQIAVAARALVGRAREGRIKPTDVEGGTFTVSNLGMFDVEDFIAIINPPEVAILAVGSVKQVPIVKDGVLAAGTRMKATISADHRATDGAEAARYLQTVRKFLEEPLRLLL
ncbi:MAG: 2-oxo acid dehydrogenase subunit E2 [Chloroflexi bacterium]|nr:2-oxo acid dehydrogenase subunit E2 [Chloroflexota bacterium]